MNAHYPLVAQRAVHRCEYCGAPEVVFNSPFEVEHMTPPLRGGADDESNWALACRACNVHKSDHLNGFDPETGAAVRLYNPRLDRWAEHFRVEARSGAVIGLTAVGRATISRLAMNSPVQLLARRQWMRLKLFPPD